MTEPDPRTAELLAGPTHVPVIAGIFHALLVTIVGRQQLPWWLAVGMGVVMLACLMAWFTRDGLGAALTGPGAWHVWVVVVVSLAAVVVAVVLGEIASLIAALVVVAVWAIFGRAWSVAWAERTTAPPDLP